MTSIRAAATEHGSVLLTVTTETGQQGEADLTIDVAETLKAQIETALVLARVRQIEATLTTAIAARPSRDLPTVAGGHPRRRERSRNLWAFLHR
jgi:hypothetical protein